MKNKCLEEKNTVSFYTVLSMRYQERANTESQIGHWSAAADLKLGLANNFGQEA